MRRDYGVCIVACSYGPCFEPGSFGVATQGGRYVSIAPKVRAYQANHLLDPSYFLRPVKAPAGNAPGMADFVHTANDSKLTQSIWGFEFHEGRRHIEDSLGLLPRLTEHCFVEGNIFLQQRREIFFVAIRNFRRFPLFLAEHSVHPTAQSVSRIQPVP
jgi:hypothetical protein